MFHGTTVWLIPKKFITSKLQLLELTTQLEWPRSRKELASKEKFESKIFVSAFHTTVKLGYNEQLRTG